MYQAQSIDLLTVMPSFCDTLYGLLSRACDDELSLTAAQMKDLLKIALSTQRQAHRIDPNQEKKNWCDSNWGKLHTRLQESSRFKSSKGLHSMCSQLIKGSQAGAKSATTEASVPKPKRKLRDGDEGRPGKKLKPMVESSKSK